MSDILTAIWTVNSLLITLLLIKIVMGISVTINQKIEDKRHDN